jgi:hypothetical protein
MGDTQQKQPSGWLAYVGVWPVSLGSTPPEIDQCIFADATEARVWVEQQRTQCKTGTFVASIVPVYGAKV